MRRTRRHRRSRGSRRSKGGEYLGEGASGCGFLPALHCKGNTAANPSQMSKLMLMSEALHAEVDVSKRIAAIDPTMTYSVYPQRVCQIEPANIRNRAENLRKCQLLEKVEMPATAAATAPAVFDPFAEGTKNADQEGLEARAKYTALLQSPYGGYDLFTVLNNQSREPVNIPSMLDMLRLLRNLIVGLEQYHDKGFYHMDIKEENIVMNRGSARYIDFGLSLTKDIIQHNPNILRRFSGRFYFAYPFELAFAGTTKEQRDALTPDALRPLIHSFYAAFQRSQRIPDILYYDRNEKPILTPDVGGWLFPILDAQQMNPTFLLEKADIYALGAVLHTCMKIMTKMYVLLDQKPYYTGPDPKTGKTITVVLDDIPEPLLMLQAVFDMFLVPYNNLCYRMMSVNPLKRPTLTEVLIVYDDAVRRLKYVYENYNAAMTNIRGNTNTNTSTNTKINIPKQ